MHLGPPTNLILTEWTSLIWTQNNYSFWVFPLGSRENNAPCGGWGRCMVRLGDWLDWGYECSPFWGTLLVLVALRVSGLRGTSRRRRWGRRPQTLLPPAPPSVSWTWVLCIQTSLPSPAWRLLTAHVPEVVGAPSSPVPGLCFLLWFHRFLSLWLLLWILRLPHLFLLWLYRLLLWLH